MGEEGLERGKEWAKERRKGEEEKKGGKIEKKGRCRRGRSGGYSGENSKVGDGCVCDRRG